MEAGPFLEASMGPGTSSPAEKANNLSGFSQRRLCSGLEVGVWRGRDLELW